MKLYHSIGPNPRFVKLFAEFKGIPLELEEVDIIAGENREKPFLELNPAGTTPVIEVEQGRFISETTAICEYLEAFCPANPLIGSEPLEQAERRMWWRRLDLMVVQPMTSGFRASEGFELFKNRVACFQESASRLKEQASEGWRWFEENAPIGRYLLGSEISVVDFLAFCFADFGAQVGQPIPHECERLNDWFGRMEGQFSQHANEGEGDV